MIPVLLILVPLISGLALFAFRSETTARKLSLFSSIITLLVSVAGLTLLNGPAYTKFSAEWMPSIHSNFRVELDGMGQLLCLLTAVSFPIIFIATWKNTYRDGARFFAFMLLSQAGLMGVFVAMDALLFYFFWELALIPAYFLCSIWGGEKRIQVTFKFFIYTFVGSLIMLVGLIYLYFQAGQSFSIDAYYAVKLAPQSESWVFWMLFIAFAIKIPVFPFHTWQPDTYEQSPTAVTMVLSGIMVKMGLFGLIRWVVPVVPLGTWAWGDTVSALAVAGIIYASLIAIRQDDLKRFVAYSSIAHMGLMVVALLATTKTGMQGIMIQMFNHGINIIGLWIVINAIEQQFNTRKMSELGGLAQKAPTLSILLVVVALANIALPLTNSFVGEFLMFNGVFSSSVTRYNIVFTVVAGISIILSAVYTLNMIQKVFYGNTKELTQHTRDIPGNTTIALSVIVALIFVIGIYPKPVLAVTNELSDALLILMNNKY